jgi:hypothetical protein
MGLKRLICKQREVISPEDPALDDDKTDFVAYLKSNFDQKHLAFKNGEQPTRWTIAPLEDKQLRHVGILPDGPLKADYVFRCGLVGVSNYEIRHEDGSFDDVDPADRKDRPEHGPMVSETWMKKARIHPDDIDTIAGMIRQISVARPLASTQSDKPPGDSTSSEKESTAPK